MFLWQLPGRNGAPIYRCGIAFVATDVVTYHLVDSSRQRKVESGLAKRYPLDTRFAIADLFDAGILKGECTVNEIADAVGASRKAVRGTLVVIGFRNTRKQKPLRECRSTLWIRPRKWPKLSRHSAVTRGIIDLYESKSVSRRCCTDAFVEELGYSEDAVVRGLKRLKFSIVKRAHKKQVGIVPAAWTPPDRWPVFFQKQRELHKGGMSTGSVMRATDLSAGVAAIIDDAVRILNVENIPLYKPGAMKATIKQVVRDVYRKALLNRPDFDTISKSDVAGWLGESRNAELGLIQSRIKGYVRFASNRKCLHCGRNPAE